MSIKMKIKIKVFVNGESFEGESSGDELFRLLGLTKKELTDKVIKATFDAELPQCTSVNDAVENTAVILGISTRQIYRVLDDLKKNGRP